ncbi:hypothetical protein GLOIN_2v1821203 [Rhizophagus irregularis DAOM 181602=DAOM 197198]|uniref:DUF8211 domain-containing protein n=1 Tax=Rhizophagus irregularis (strain DAOM 181602 / DAOM 197198 / MUCL 43194) TaxID=747089 RepID=A0A2P4NZI4_RHIID|nr:hypothetical protein GLOIN_2v1821203 [Rhizophagus irregularis DAOM 181602=DAOM 197198]POG58550.1 hypothetical protein GLOIN_2v1821203 [Rhizophagus irregularis DAOM 181602=DAOM 197198]|eukprot:XP_025165416.1 hypothetical protein GLOIN_2v1821203 [Rhizophagus irregularis DAOM 181602=DAOM 197198]
MRFDHLKTHSKATAASILSPFQIHSNLIHQRWKSKETKTIYSNRLGITYTSRYVNTKHKSNDKDGWQFMYNKRLENFNHINSTNTRTYTRSPHIISDTATPSPSTTPPTTPPPGACSVPMLVDSDEDDASPGHQKRFSNFINKCQAHQDISPFVTTSEKSIYVFLDDCSSGFGVIFGTHPCFVYFTRVAPSSGGIITACAATNCVEDPVPIRAEMIPTDATDGEVVDAIIGRLVWRVLEMVTELRSKPLLCHEVCQSVMGDCCQMVHKGSIASWYPGGPSGL